MKRKTGDILFAVASLLMFIASVRVYFENVQGNVVSSLLDLLFLVLPACVLAILGYQQYQRLRNSAAKKRTEDSL